MKTKNRARWVLKGGRLVKLELFGEALCPYCTQHLLHHVLPLFQDPDLAPFGTSHPSRPISRRVTLTLS